MYKGLETPPHEMLERDGAIELRRYAPYLLAETSVEGSRQRAAARAFRRLARYIFGGNRAGAKIAMTAPVAQWPEDGGAGPRWTVSFMMPAAYDSPESLPAPQAPDIRLTRAEPGLQAVIRFSGRWSDRGLADATEALRGWIEARGLTAIGPPRYYFYDDPFTLPFRRRNEVAIPVA